MALQPPSLVPGPGIQPFDYEVIVNNIGLGSYSTLVNLQSVSLGYEVDENRAYFSMWDSDSVTVANAAIPPTFLLPTPKNGDDIQIVVREGMNAVSRTIFRGKIDSVAERRTPEGLIYSCSAVTRARLLNERSVTMALNIFNDPIRSQPSFDADTGEMLEKAGLMTVYEVVREIMNFRDAWLTDEPYVFNDILWHGLDNQESCGLYKVTGITYQDAPKFIAITEILQRAGNYRLHYDPGANKFHVVELNLAANRCGSIWPITFPAVTPGQGVAVAYAGNLQLMSDQTEWTTRASANVVRITSDYIRFYSGNNIIPEMVENLTKANPTPGGPDLAVAEADRLRATENDTVALQKARAINQDGTYYRFQYPYKVWEDPRQYQEYVVGAPMFPDWNVYEDFLPDIITILGVMPPANIPATKTEADYIKQKVEFQPVTLGQMIVEGHIRLGHPNDMKAYQAWRIKGVCPGCNGSGNVLAIYSGGSNLPTIEWEDVYGGKNKRPKITNYLFDPTQFGHPNADTSMLTPFNMTIGYPVPWRNLCPVCRGVGFQPSYKVRNIQPDLVSGRASKDDHGTPAGVLDTPIDPEFTETDPESWDEAQNRQTIQSGPRVVIEEPVLSEYRLPLFAHRHKNWAQLKALAEADRTVKFDHPLKGFKKQLATLLAITGDDANLIPNDTLWNSVKAVFTTLKTQGVSYQLAADTGRLLFTDEPPIIACEVRYRRLKQATTKGQVRYQLNPNGLIDESGTVEGPQMVNPITKRPLGVWRPPRIWMQYFYVKHGYFHRIVQEPTEFTYTDADGQTNTYFAKAMILDGKWCCEVYKARPDTWGDDTVEFGNTDRVVQVAVTDNSAVIETTEEDLVKMLVPPVADIGPEAYETIRRDDFDLDFPTARMLKWEALTPGEVLLELAGVNESIPAQALARPRFYKWRLRDDRPKLLAMAVRQLETSNDIMVRGSLAIRGATPDLTRGLGYVDYPGKAKACVVRVNQVFDNGFTTSLEVTRSEAHHGELPPDDKISLTGLTKEFRQYVYEQRASRGSSRPTNDLS